MSMETPDRHTAIILRGVRVHNLQSIDLDLPLHRLIVVSGVSGSGKSSLAFDTLAAEGQRRYIESYSNYARQFLDRLEKPDADRIHNIPPAVAIRQSAASRSRRSTVATATEIHDCLRLLFARVGTVVCPACQRAVCSDSPASVTSALQRLPDGTRYQVCFPFECEGAEREKRPGNSAVGGNQPLQALREDGFTRCIVNGRTCDLRSESIEVPPGSEPVLIVVDRLAAGSAALERIADSVELAFQRGQGECTVLVRRNSSAADRSTGSADSTGTRSTARDSTPPVPIDGAPCDVLRFSSRMACSGCGQQFVAPEPRLFSFNSPLGACARCHGLGQLPVRAVRSGTQPRRAGSRADDTRPRHRAMETCPDCHGRRLQPQALAVRLAPWDFAMGGDNGDGHNGRSGPPASGRVGSAVLPTPVSTQDRPLEGLDIAAACALTVEELHAFLCTVQTADESRRLPLHAILPQLLSRLEYLKLVGLEYLTLDRPLVSLSGGEAHRVSLTAALGSHLVNTLYVLDEPTAGLHPGDTERLLTTIERLRDAGNTVVVVEHDPLVLRRADQLIDIGPGAGSEGGRVVFQGPPADAASQTGTPTGDYLSGRRQIANPSSGQRRSPHPVPLRLAGARHHNLQNITVEFPLGVLCVVTGVSGSGKSSLVEETLYRALCRKLGDPGGPEPGPFDSLSGAESLAAVVLIDQTPVGRTPRSNPATCLKIFNAIRELFAETAEAKVRNYAPRQFGFNTATGGRCPTCQGNGSLAIDMQFLPDVTMVCPDCRGARFRREVLEIKYRGLNIAEVLAMTVRDAFPFFRGQSRLQRRLKLLKDVGLDYVTLGQPANTLSGGESQRLKLAACMGQGGSARTLFILNEPTTGLHPADVARLLDCLAILLAAGHSLIVIEHNLDLIRCADQIIDLGPGAGPGGGRVVAQGTPAEVARVSTSLTGRYLRAER